MLERVSKSRGEKGRLRLGREGKYGGDEGGDWGWGRDCGWLSNG